MNMSFEEYPKPPNFNTLRILNLNNISIDLTDLNGVEKYHDLRELSINTRGKYIDLSAMKNLPKLKNLYMYNSVIDADVISEMINLHKIEFINCGLSNVSFLSKLINLTHLNISRNFIDNIGELKNLINLKELKLNHNNISDISVIHNLKNLTKLEYRENPIDDKYYTIIISKLPIDLEKIKKMAQTDNRKKIINKLF